MEPFAKKRPPASERIVSQPDRPHLAVNKSICLAAGLALLALAGCQSPTPQDRIAANQALFASWPADVQAKVRAGIVAVGFTPDQVRMALGDPVARSVTGATGGTTEIWVYDSRAPRLSFSVGGASFGRSSAVGGGVAANGIKLGQDVGGRVVFQNGRVIEVEITVR